jgi:hypothetical protein
VSFFPPRQGADLHGHNQDGKSRQFGFWYGQHEGKLWSNQLKFHRATSWARLRLDILRHRLIVFSLLSQFFHKFKGGFVINAYAI